MEKRSIILAKRPDLVLKLEKYGLLPSSKKEGPYEGCAKKWAKTGTPPYDTPEAQALAERLPTGWEEVSSDEFRALLDKLQEKITEKKRGKIGTQDTGGKKMATNLVKVAFLGVTAIASIISEAGIGVLPEGDEQEKKRVKQFSFELVLHLINETNILNVVFKEIARTTQTSEENQQWIGEILKLMALLMILLTNAKGNEDRLKTLVESFKQTIEEGIKRSELFVSEQLEKGTFSGERAERAALSLQQARMALGKEDFEGLYDAFRDALGIVETAPDLFIGDLKEIEECAEKIRIALTTGMDAETAKITTMSQAM